MTNSVFTKYRVPQTRSFTKYRPSEFRFYKTPRDIGFSLKSSSKPWLLLTWKKWVRLIKAFLVKPVEKLFFSKDSLRSKTHNLYFDRALISAKDLFMIGKVVFSQHFATLIPGSSLVGITFRSASEVQILDWTKNLIMLEW